MEQNTYAPEILDLRRQSRVWDRVGPQLPPYQDENANGENDPGRLALGPVAGTLQEDATLPGAEQDPCCMGSAAAELTAVLLGFGTNELLECNHLRAMSGQAPGWAVSWLREMAGQHARQARRLFTAYYLITGTCYAPEPQRERIYVGRWCPALRERYHAAACNAMNYERAAESTTDICLQRMLRELGAASYRQSETLLTMLEQSMGISGGSVKKRTDD